MARMFGFIGNRADLGARVLELTPSLRNVDTEGSPVGWGIGFHQAGEVLLRRRPLDERAVIDLAEVARGVRTDVLIGHVRKPTIGGLRTENTHPFRYRHWLFASTGTIQGFDKLRERLIESQPEFLRRNVRGDTDSELFFYLFLSFLHDSGGVHDESLPAEQARAALTATINLVDRLSAEEGFEGGNAGDVLVTNGEHMIGVSRDDSMAYRVLRGRHDVEDVLGDGGLVKASIPNVDTARFSIVASGFTTPPERWTRVLGRAMVTLTRTDEPEVTTM